MTDITLLEIKQHYHASLDKHYDSNEVDSFFYISLEHILKINKVAFALDPNKFIGKGDYTVFKNIISKLIDHIPIQYITGETEFYGLRFMVDRSVLIPRPETEELVAWVLESVPKMTYKIRILDIGTGSGAIAISLAKHVPGSIVFALDISLEALTVVKKNAEFNNVKVNCIQADILNQNHEGLDLKHMKFDIIVSNPPYVRYSEKKDMKANVLENEPHLALFVKDDNPLEYYNAITTFAKRCLNKNGLLFFEINQYLGHETCEVLSTQNFKTIELKKDINGNHRMIKAQLI